MVIWDRNQNLLRNHNLFMVNGHESGLYGFGMVSFMCKFQLKYFPGSCVWVGGGTKQSEETRNISKKAFHIQLLK